MTEGESHEAETVPPGRNSERSPEIKQHDYHAKRGELLKDLAFLYSPLAAGHLMIEDPALLAARRADIESKMRFLSNKALKQEIRKRDREIRAILGPRGSRSDQPKSAEH